MLGKLCRNITFLSYFQAQKTLIIESRTLRFLEATWLWKFNNASCDRGSKGENDNITLLTLELFSIRALEGLRVEGEEREVLQDI